MGWKNWSYWLKGGVSYTLMGIILIGLSYFLSEVVLTKFDGVIMPIIIILLLLFGPIWIPISLDLGFNDISLSSAYGIKAVISGIIIQIIWSFVIGSIIGFIYGKIKNRKEGK